MARYLLMVSLIIRSFTLLSQTSETEYITQARHAIFTLDTGMASRMLDLEKAQNPENGYIYYYQNYLHFLQVLFSGDRVDYHRYTRLSADRLNSLGSLDESHPDYLYFLSAVNLQTFLLDFFHGEYWHGAKAFLRAHRQIQENQSIHPAYPGNRKILGIIELLLSSVPPEKEWLFDILGLRGDRDGGMERLHNYYDECGPGDRPEALLIFALASNYYATDPSAALSELSAAWDEGRNSPLYQYIYALLARKAGRPDEARKILEQSTADTGAFRIPFADLLMGELLLSSREGEAGVFFGRFINRYKGTNLKKVAWHKLSWYYFLQGEDRRYQEYRNLARTEGSTFLEQDKQAMEEAGDTNELNQLLLWARILYDGNRYRDALNLLLEAGDEDLATARDRVEYSYRLARVYHALGDLPRAKENYGNVIEKRAGCPCYFIPYSALQLAEIHEEAGEYAAAEKMYSSCLELNRFQYRGSIGSRARAGLKRVRDHSNE